MTVPDLDFSALYPYSFNVAKSKSIEETDLSVYCNFTYKHSIWANNWVLRGVKIGDRSEIPVSLCEFDSESELLMKASIYDIECKKEPDFDFSFEMMNTAGVHT